MNSTEAKTGEPNMTEMLKITVGQEADFYLERMKELESSKFAVIKVGGDTVQRDLDLLSADVAMLANVGLYPIIVHGGGPQINTDLKARGIEPRKFKGKRITDEATLESVERGLGQVNDTIVSALVDKGVAVEGIMSGVFEADFEDQEHLGHVGKVKQVKTSAITEAIEQGKVPVVSCLGEGANGSPLNINGDTAARALSVEMQPHRFIMLTNRAGVLDKDGQVISVINDNQKVEALIEDGTISEGMIPKVQDGMRALHDLPEESSVIITNPQQLIRELFTHQGAGTLLRHGDAITHLPSVEAVDQEKVRDLIETAFGKQLIDNYFEQLPANAEIFITDRGYRGVAIVLPGEDGQPAYIDKLVVRPEDRGRGIGDELVDKVTEVHPEGVYWRVRRDNKSLDWYRSRGRGQEYDWEEGEWILFFTKEVPTDSRAMYAGMAALKEQTVLAATDNPT